MRRNFVWTELTHQQHSRISKALGPRSAAPLKPPTPLMCPLELADPLNTFYYKSLNIVQY